MTPQDLLANFETLAEAPNGIQRLRELVLELAVRGKLVEQDLEDEPAPDLLKRIKSEKAQLIAHGAIRGGKHLPEIGQNEAPFELPPTWQWSRLRSIARDLGQKVPDVPFSYIDVGSIDNQRGRITESPEVLEPAAAPSRARKLVSTGTVIFSTVRPYLMNIAVVSKEYDPAPIVSTAFAALHPFQGIDSTFLFWLLRSPFFMDWVSDRAKGVAYPAISDGDLQMAPVPVPPVAEQRRIVARVDELMALLDRLEAKRQEREAARAAARDSALAVLREAPTPDDVETAWLLIQERFHELFATPEDVEPLRQAILQLGVQGKVVPQYLNDEPVEAMLKLVSFNKLRLQIAGKIGKDKSKDSTSQTNASFQIPESWRWAKLEELTELITKGSSPKWQGISYVTKDEGVLFITSENVGNYKLRKLTDLKYVESRFNEIEPRSVLKNGDILINLVGASIGRSAKYNMNDGANINQAVALIRRLRGNEGVCPDFLLHYLNSPSAIDYMLGSRVVNAQPNISLTDVREFPVPIPPLSEQRRIVEKLDELMSLLDYLVGALDSQHSLACAFTAAAVHHLDA